MLELQIIPESSIETDHWKIELGKQFKSFI